MLAARYDSGSAQTLIRKHIATEIWFANFNQARASPLHSVHSASHCVLQPQLSSLRFRYRCVLFFEGRKASKRRGAVQNLNCKKEARRFGCFGKLLLASGCQAASCLERRTKLRFHSTKLQQFDMCVCSPTFFFNRFCCCAPSPFPFVEAFRACPSHIHSSPDNSSRGSNHHAERSGTLVVYV